MENDDNFSEYINYREIEIESVSESSKIPSIMPSSSISKRSSFADSTSGKITKKLKLSKPEKSFVWKHFKKIETNEKVQVQCIVPVMKNEKEEPCNTTHKFTGSTSNMKYHLNAIHNITDEDNEIKVNVIL